VISCEEINGHQWSSGRFQSSQRFDMAEQREIQFRRVLNTEERTQIFRRRMKMNQNMRGGSVKTGIPGRLNVSVDGEHWTRETQVLTTLNDQRWFGVDM
jgi:hypothetical protein